MQPAPGSRIEELRLASRWGVGASRPEIQIAAARLWEAVAGDPRGAAIAGADGLPPPSFTRFLARLSLRAGDRPQQVVVEAALKRAEVFRRRRALVLDRTVTAGEPGTGAFGGLLSAELAEIRAAWQRFRGSAVQAELAGKDGDLRPGAERMVVAQVRRHRQRDLFAPAVEAEEILRRVAEAVARRRALERGRAASAQRRPKAPVRSYPARD